MTKIPFQVEKYEEQTKMKHLVFDEYIDKWIKILGARNKLNYIDGFAGIGAYLDENTGDIFYGSPVIVGQAVKHLSKKLQREVNVILIDTNRRNLENIKKIFDYEKIRAETFFIPSDFDKTINNILNSVKDLAPTLVFVDPFGFSIKMKTLLRIMEISKSEVLLNFMFNAVNRFLTVKKIRKTVIDLFNLKNEKELNWMLKELDKRKKQEREKFIIEFYRQKLKEEVKYVYNYKLEFPKKRRTYYYLFHLSNYWLGCSVMKSCFVNYAGRVEYRGERSGEISFFELPKIKEKEIEHHLLKRYPRKKISFIDLICEEIDNTPYTEKMFRNCLKKMERNKAVKIKRVTSKTKRGLGGSDLIIF